MRQFICFICFLSLLGCGQKPKSTFEGLEIESIKADGKLSDQIDVKDSYLLLDTVADANIMHPSKIIKANDGSIWICNDMIRQYNLVNFSSDGKWIKTFSKQGQGPGEYLDISDFEITPDGTLYILDGRLDKVMVYDSTGEFVKSFKPPFEADMFHVLKNGNILFGLSTWDEGYGKEWRVALTDSEANPIKFMIPADDLYDPNIWLGRSGFTIREDGKIVYNREIDDRIFIFNDAGEIESVAQLDFGKYTVADEDKKNIEDNPNFENYRNIVGMVGMADGKFMGNILVNGQNALFVTEKENTKIQPIDKALRHIGFINEYMVQPITSDEYETLQLPDSVAQHINNEGMALRFLKF